MKIYENVIIGNFLYGLGVDVGLKVGLDKETKYPALINLLQQTPSDKLLGDMVVEFPGIVRVLEFKNKDNPSDKEQIRVKALNDALKGQKRIQEISRELHWYIETKPFEQICANKIVPYLDAYNGTPSQYILEEFISSITKEMLKSTSTVTHEEQKAYLDLIAKCQNGSGSGSGKVGTGGLIVSVSNKGIQYVEFSSIEQLRLQHKEFKHEINLKCETVMQKDWEYELEQKKKLELKRERYNSINMGMSR